MKKTLFSLLLAFWGSSITVCFAAGSFGFEAEYRADYSDNALQDEEDQDKVEELTNNYRVSASGLYRGSRNESSFVANLELIDYTDDTAEDVALSSFIGASEFALTRRSVSWIFVDALGYYDNEPSLGLKKRDLDRVNFFLTGPKIRYDLDSDTELGFSLYYLNRDRQGEQEDYNQYDARLSWEFQPSNRSALGLELRSEHTQFVDQSFDTDYSISSLISFYQYRTLANTYSIALGGTYLERLDGEQQETSGSFDAEWDHAFTRRSRMQLSAGYNLSDESILTTSAISGDGTFDQDDEGLFYESSLSARYSFDGIYADFNFGLTARSLEFIGDNAGAASFNNDHESYALNAGYLRYIGRYNTLELGFSAEHKQYIEEDFDETLFVSKVIFGREIGRTLKLNLGLELQQGSGNVPRANTVSEEQEYDEFLVTLGILWEPRRIKQANRQQSNAFDLGLIGSR